LTIYYQHIGEVMWARDAPRSIGTSSAGLIHFSFRDIEPFLKELDAFELGSIERQSRKLAPTGFQIWGIPSGAHRVLEPMQQAISCSCWRVPISRMLARLFTALLNTAGTCPATFGGEARFPLIILLNGELISYSWMEFREHFGFATNYHMRGNTMRLNPNRIASSPSRTEEAFIARLLATAGTNPFDL
jgi:hypothetical protein